AIYPGVTQFGTRFDVYNDATVIDLLRSEELPGFAAAFLDVMTARFPSDFPEDGFARGLTKLTVASFLAQAVLGNMRGFVFACNALRDATTQGEKAGLPDLGASLVRLASNYYWPLLEEIQPKLGKYELMIPPAQQIAETVFVECAQKPRSPRDIIVH